MAESLQEIARRYIEWYESRSTVPDPDTTPIEDSPEKLAALRLRLVRTENREQ